MLGLKLTSTGYTAHYRELHRRGRAALSNIQRFRKLTTRNKTLLYQALVKSIITYPTIPTHTCKHSHIKKLQSIQNEGLKFIHNTYYPHTVKSKRLHERSGMTPINLTLHNRAQQIWNNILQQPDTITQNSLLDADLQHTRYHTWFPSSRKHLQRNPFPLPFFAPTRNRNINRQQ